MKVASPVSHAILLMAMPMATDPLSASFLKSGTGCCGATLRSHDTSSGTLTSIVFEERRTKRHMDGSVSHRRDTAALVYAGENGVCRCALIALLAPVVCVPNRFP